MCRGWPPDRTSAQAILTGDGSPGPEGSARAAQTPDWCGGGRPAARDNILTFFAGTNDIACLGLDAAEMMARLRAYVAAAHATGFKVAVSTLLPRAEFSAGQEATRQAFNAELAAAWRDFANALADVNANPTMGGAPSVAANARLYLDGIHPTTTGYSLLAPVFAAAVNSLLAR